MTIYVNAKFILLFCLLCIAVILDIRTTKIKNSMIIFFAFAGLLINLLVHGWNGLIFSVEGILIPILGLVILYKLRMMGAGDIKLFSSIGALMGPVFVLEVMVLSFFTGSVIAVFYMITRRNILERFKYITNYFKICFISCSLLPYDTFEKNNKQAKFPFTLAIITGAFIKVLFNRLEGITTF